MQAFYLHQNLFWEKTGKLIELAKNVSRSRNLWGMIEHIPWWVFASSYKFDHDVLFGGHVICEMSERSVRQVLSRSVASNQVPVLILESSGDQRLTQMQSRINLIREYGYVQTFEQLDLYIFVHPNTNPVIVSDVQNFTSNFKFKAKPRWLLSNKKNSRAMDEAKFYYKLMQLGKGAQEIVPAEKITQEYKKYNSVNWDENFLREIKA